MTTQPESGIRCCSHRSADHGRSGDLCPKPGTICTVPDCKCAGFIPRKLTGKEKARRVAKAMKK